ncbi:MAG TPA: helical backbone metal receptor [Syntrophorhabdaceae bacterium]|nr:helical backbone metal receptor [Syntrophorhabdaceae bacterium]
MKRLKEPPRKKTMRIKYSIFLFFLCFLFLLFSPLTLSCYERIISLSPQVTESIYLIGAEQRLIANTTFCKRPPDALKKEKIGTPQRPELEKIVSLKPDLVIAAQEANDFWFVERIKKIGINTFFFKRPKDFKDLSHNFFVLGKLLKKEETAKKIIMDVKQKLHKDVKSKQFGVLWQIGSGPVVVATNTSFVNDIIEYSGGKNIINSEVPYMRISIEEIIKNPPQVIVLMDMGYSIQEEEKRWKKYLKDPVFVVLDPYVASSPTPVTFLEAVTRLKEARNF